MNTELCACGRSKTHRGACSARAVASGHRDFEGDVLFILKRSRSPSETEFVALVSGMSRCTARKHLAALEKSGKATRDYNGLWRYVPKRLWPSPAPKGGKRHV